MPINPNDGRSPVQQVTDDLRARIETGEWQPGSKLPVTHELVEAYGVSAETLRHAIGRLKAAGLLETKRGVGTFVRKRPPMQWLAAERYSRSKRAAGKVAFIADREASGRSWNRDDQTQTVRECEATQEIAEGLQISVGAPVIERARLVVYKGDPTQRLTSWYRLDDVRDTPIADPNPGPAGTGGGFSVLDELGIGPDEIEEQISARMPTAEEEQVLHIPVGEPVFDLRRTAYTITGRPVEYARGTYRAGHFTWRYRFKVPD
jgi:GntR family transcriptional regulator